MREITRTLAHDIEGVESSLAVRVVLQSGRRFALIISYSTKKTFCIQQNVFFRSAFE